MKDIIHVTISINKDIKEKGLKILREKGMTLSGFIRVELEKLLKNQVKKIDELNYN